MFKCSNTQCTHTQTEEASQCPVCLEKGENWSLYPVSESAVDQNPHHVTTAGDVDLRSLLETMRKPPEWIDADLAAEVERQAQELAKEFPEIAIARAYLSAAIKANALYLQFTTETKAHGETSARLDAVFRKALEACGTEPSGGHDPVDEVIGLMRVFRGQRDGAWDADVTIRALVAKLDGLRYQDMSRHENLALLETIHAELRKALA